LAIEINSALKSSDQKTYKHEVVLNQTFFSEGKVGDIDWELTGEKKEINGLQCYEAKAKNRELMLTAWYTKEIPVSNGPSIYQGLPGLVVWVEDFFRTIELIDFEYIENGSVADYQQMYNKYLNAFNDKKNQKHREKEPLLIVKKSDAANDIYQMIHGKNY